MDKIIGLNFKWECSKCGTLTAVKVLITQRENRIIIRPNIKCNCGTARKDYLLLDIEKTNYELEEIKNETSTLKASG